MVKRVAGAGARGLGLAVAIAVGGAPVAAQQRGATNYDESKVAASALPDPLRSSDGRTVSSREVWEKQRRPEILELFAEHVYGHTPAARVAVRSEQRSIAEDALGGRAVRKQITLRFGSAADGPSMDLLLYLPRAARQPVPCFLGLNFRGNHAVSSDPGIALARGWLPDGPGVVEHRASEAGRGSAASRWPIEAILARGYALVTASYHDLDPDFDDGFQNGVQPLFYRPGQRRPAANEWGAIGAWAWGLSRALDQLETEPGIDSKKVALIGHSRLGKAALWAGAQDERFAIVISNDSGEGGAALSRRDYGETIADLNRQFPHWFCANYKRYSGNASALPVDQHLLLSLIAPRPLYVASATEDRWADPLGEFLAAKAAEPVYRLFGLEGLGVERQPPPDTAVGQTIRYHLRTGKHDVTRWDWDRYLDFADRHFGVRPAAPSR